MGIVDLRTDLKSIKFGKDVVGGGNSNQPYVVRDIPESFQDVGRTGGPDFLLRGGTLLPRRVINDTSRMVQMLFDFKSPNGPLFIAKQNVLSLTNVNTAVGYVDQQDDAQTGVGKFIQDNLALNQGIYTPLSTVAATIGNPFGVHPNKQGLNPFNPNLKLNPLNNQPGSNNPPGLTLPTYIGIIKGDVQAGTNTRGVKSRLFGLLPKINTKPSSDQSGANTLYSYTGGPGATLGVGKTVINMLNDQRTGINNPLFTDLTIATTNTGSFTVPAISGGFLSGFTSAFTPTTAPSFDIPTLTYKPSNIEAKPATSKTTDSNITELINNNLKFRTGGGAAYFANNDANGILDYTSAFLSNGTLKIFNIYESNDNDFSLETKIDNQAFKSGINNRQQISTFTQRQIIDKVPTSKDATFDKPNFETEITNVDTNTLIPNSPDYVTQNIENRVNLGNPGRKGLGTGLKSYTLGKEGTSNDPSVDGSVILKPMDKITGMPIYQSNGVLTGTAKNDLVKFRIGIIDTDKPTKKTYIHFRAFIDSLSDAYSSEWDSSRYMGRSENFYKFKGFDRQVNLAWTVAAQSKQELIPMYQKLNFLASSLAGNYNKSGYFAGNLVTLTMGGWFYEQPGILTSMTLDVPDDSPWEIAINDQGQSDSTVKELPHIIKVSGVNFIPIHEFVPRLQQNNYSDKNSYEGMNGGNWIETYGRERYLALNNGVNNNYDVGENGFNYIPTSKPLA